MNLEGGTRLTLIFNMKNFCISKKSVSIAPDFELNQESSKNRYLTVKLLSSYLHISTSYIYKKISDNSIPHIKIDKRIIFDRELIDLWLSNNCQPYEDFPSIKSA